MLKISLINFRLVTKQLKQEFRQDNYKQKNQIHRLNVTTLHKFLGKNCGLRKIHVQNHWECCCLNQLETCSYHRRSYYYGCMRCFHSSLRWCLCFRWCPLTRCRSRSRRSRRSRRSLVPRTNAHASRRRLTLRAQRERKNAVV